MINSFIDIWALISNCMLTSEIGYLEQRHVIDVKLIRHVNIGTHTALLARSTILRGAWIYMKNANINKRVSGGSRVAVVLFVYM